MLHKSKDLVAVAWFLPGRATDLIAYISVYIYTCREINILFIFMRLRNIEMFRKLRRRFANFAVKRKIYFELCNIISVI
jgi:hypothetical protein